MKLRLIALSGAFLSAACGADPEAAPIGSMTQAIRAGAGEAGNVFVGADLLVTESSGEAIPCGVGEVEFRVEVSRNGAQGPYELVDSGRVHRTCTSPSQGQLALVLDNSQSLDDELPILESAALRVADTVIDNGGSVSLTRVSTNATVLSPLSSDREAVRGAIEGMFVSNGWTALYDGIRMANETMGESSGPGHGRRFGDAGTFCAEGSSRSIVVFTDGAENNSRHQEHWSSDYPGDGVNTSLGDLLQLNVAATSTPVYTVGLGPEADHKVLGGLAEASGGRHVALDDPGDIEDVLAMLAEYGQSTHRVCTQLPDHVCGSLDVKVSHRFENKGKGKSKGNVVEGSTVQHIELPCPARAAGRVATVLLTLDASDLAPDTVRRLLAQTVNWVSPVDAPRVLFVRDDFHHDEFAYDTGKLYQTLVAAGYSASLMDEPSLGLSLADLEGYDVVWFSNPGHPIDDIATFHALLQFSEAGGGVVMQGDDISWSHGHSFPIDRLTQLSHVDNGTKYCGRTIDNGRGAYEVAVVSGTHPIVAGLGGQRFSYSDDIDTTMLLAESSDQTEVLAWATVKGQESCGQKPVIVAYTPNRDGAP